MNRKWFLAGGVVLVLGLTAFCHGQNVSSSGRGEARKGARTGSTAFLRKLNWSQELPANPDTLVSNAVRITNTGASQVDRAIVLSRFFRKGEIPHSPLAQIDNQPLPTQSDIKTRWDDGSVQHAIVSVRANIGERGTLDVAFVDSSRQSAETGALTADEMLSGAFDFGGRMELVTPESTRTVDIREMVKAGAFRYWLAGPITTQIIVEDATPASRFDVDFNGHKSFHPIFIATFHPGQRSVKIDFIGENAWVDRLQDITYSVMLRAGNPLREPFYDKGGVQHIASSRWRKTGWSGEAPPRLVVDYSLPYLIYSRAVPNFDLSFTIPDSAVKSAYTAFLSGDRGDLGGRGLWAKQFSMTGGRGELGLFPRWDVMYLYTFSPDAETISRAYADVSGYVPIHFRESSTGRRYHPAVPNVDAFGRLVSIDARPGFVSRGQSKSVGGDAAVPVGPVSNGGWQPDTAHQGSFAYIAYLTTGDYYYLDEILAWAAWDIAFADSGTCQWCRGGDSESNGSWGFVYGSSNTRAYGWTFRNLAHAALLAPDGGPEKAYFTDKFLNNLAVLEGRFKIENGFTVTDPARQAMFRHGQEVVVPNIPNALRTWDSPIFGNVSPRDAATLDVTKTFHMVAPWMHNLIYVCLGHVEELGFPAGPLRRDVMKNLLGQLVDSSYNPYLVESYFIPSAGAKGEYFQDWGSVKSAFAPDYAARSTWEASRIGDAEFGYGYIALAAASFLQDVEWNQTNGMAGRDWLDDIYPKNAAALAANPKWALVPRNYRTRGSLAAPDSWASRFKRALIAK